MEYNERILELLELFRMLNNNEIKPSKIVGTGLKDPRKIAFQYIQKELSHEIIHNFNK